MRYQPKKHKSPLKAIRENCIECMGGVGNNPWKLVEECAAVDCALHDFRFGKNPFYKLNLTPEQKQKRVDAMSRGRGAP